MLDAEHPEAVFKRPAPAAGDDTDLIADFDRIGQRITVLGIVAADEIAVERGDDAPVGHHAVDIENEGFTARYIFFEVSHIL